MIKEGEETINQRLNLIVDTFERGTKSAFAAKIGISAQGVHDLLSGRKGSPSFKVLSSILEGYPQVDANWLVRGQGPMLRGGEREQPSDATSQDYVTREQYQAFTTEMHQEIERQVQLFEAYKHDLSEKAQLEQVYRIGDVHPANKKLADRLSITADEARDLVLSGRIRSTYMGKDNDRARQNGVSYLITEEAVREFLGDRIGAR